MSISLLKEQLDKNGIFDRIYRQLEKEHELTLKKSIGALNSFLLASLSSQKQNVLVISETDEGARFLKSDLDIISPDHPIILFPSSNRKPYDQHQLKDTSLLVQRSEALQAISDHASKMVITSVEAISEKIAPPSALNEVSLILEKGQEVDLDTFKSQLVAQGYRSVKFVDEPGEFAIRGGIIDVFPYSGEYPLRLEFFGDELDTIREFDAGSQRSIAFLNQARIIPDLTNLPQSEKSSFLSYFGEETLLVTSNRALIIGEMQHTFEQAEAAYEEQDDTELPLPQELYLSGKDIESEIIAFKHQLFVANVGASEKDEKTITLDAKPQPDFHGNFKLLREQITKNSAECLNTFILCGNEGQRARFEELLGEASQDFKYRLVVESLHEGFVYAPAGIAVYTDHQIFNRYHRPKTKRRRFHGGISFKELKDLSIGDFVVHVDYGIGKFAGFKKINVKNTEQEVVVLRYKEESTLYVNVSSLHKLQKYSGKEGTAPRITRLGSGEWARKKSSNQEESKGYSQRAYPIVRQEESGNSL
jgi:transcription-repair coupling factor (superfamily II helicase)